MAKARPEMLLISKVYDLVVWSCRHVAKFPKSHRFTLGDRLELRLYEVLERLIRAKYTRDRHALLRSVNVELELLRFQFRIAKDLQCLSVDSYGFAARSVDEVGRLLGGWIKHLEAARTPVGAADQLSEPGSRGAYRTFRIFDPKPRLISAAPYRDRVVHHALCRVIEPVFEPTFVFDSYACRRGKGTHAAVNRLSAFARRYRYVLTCDVSRYFPSIDHDILEALLARKLKDPDVLWLVNPIIDRSNPQEPVLEWFDGDDLFTPAERRRGLPIGNQTSQFFGNVYLNPLDHFVAETLGAPAYVRYVDDFVLLADDKVWLAAAREHCRRYLETLRLRLHPRKCVISRVEDGVRFLGYRVFADHRRLGRENVVRMRRRLRRMQTAFASGELSAAKVRHRLVSWIGHAGHADTYRLRQRLFDATTFSRGADRALSGGGQSVPWCGAGPGTTKPGTPGRPSATTIHPTTATTT